MSSIKSYSNYGMDKEGNIVNIYYLPNTDGLKEINYEHYKLIKYNSESELNPSNSLIRSIIFSNEELVCYSPQKSIPFDIFKTNPIENIFIEEIIEGTMINLFFDKHVDKWVIASKSNIGANCKFFAESITFNEMYQECLLNSSLNYDCLNKEYCYSFVIQHPKNRIVVPFEHTSLYLINVYHCYTKDNLNLVECIHIHSTEILSMFEHSTVKFPKLYNFDSYDSIVMPDNWFFKGFMLKMDFYRCKVLNVNYEHIKELRGNQPKLKYYYLMIRQNSTLNEFIKYYPEYVESINSYEKEIKKYTHQLYKFYVSCFIHKEQKLRDYLPKYKTHMYHLHQIYITKLAPKKNHMNYMITENYINNLHPSQLMYSLNYDYHTHDNNEHVIINNDTISNDYFIIS